MKRRGPEKLGSRARAGSAEARRLEDAAVEVCIAILQHLHRPVSTKRCLRCAAVADIAPDFLRSEDWKKGCAYDPGALNKQGALQSQTLRYMFHAILEFTQSRD